MSLPYRIPVVPRVKAEHTVSSSLDFSTNGPKRDTLKITERGDLFTIQPKNLPSKRKRGDLSRGPAINPQLAKIFASRPRFCTHSPFSISLFPHTLFAENDRHRGRSLSRRTVSFLSRGEVLECYTPNDLAGLPSEVVGDLGALVSRRRTYCMCRCMGCL